MFGLKPDELAAYATLASVIVGGFALLREIRHTTTVSQIDLMLKFDESSTVPKQDATDWRRAVDVLERRGERQPVIVPAARLYSHCVNS